ncbi:MAG: hypothetical protein ACLSW4_04480 [Clostridia bacterium]
MFYRNNIEDIEDNNNKEPSNFIESQKFKDFLNKLDLKSMIYRLFAIPNEINSNNCKYLNELQWDIVKCNYDKFTEEEQQELKWLLYDVKNSNGNRIVDIDIPKDFICNCNELYVYFTDIKIKNAIMKKLKTHTLGFYENESKTIKYLKFIDKKNYKLYNEFHKFVISKCKYEQYVMNKNDVIDHIQEAPLYFYDYNYFYNITNAKMKKPKTLKYNNKEYVKSLIYCKIIESWKATNRLIKNNQKPQFNNCNYNLKELDKNINRNIKAKIIDKSKIIYPRTYKNKPELLYMNFYFPKSQKLKTTNGTENIVLLSIIYNLEDISYTNIIEELYSNIFKDNTKDNYDENIDYSKLFEYIKGKDILYMIEDSNNINQKAILETKDIFYENKEIVLVKNYQ